MGTEIEKHQTQKNQLEQSLIGTESKPFLYLEKSEKEVKQLIALHTLLFITESYPATNGELLSKEVAKELYDRKNWKLQDVKEFFRFIKDNATKKEFQVIGNSIGMMHFMRFIILYEEKKSEERESKYFAHKNAESTQPLPVPKEYIEKILKTIQKGNYNDIITRTPEKHFDPIAHPADFDIFKAMIKEGKAEDKKKWKASIADFYSIVEEEMERKKELIELLK